MDTQILAGLLGHPRTTQRASEDAYYAEHSRRRPLALIGTPNIKALGLAALLLAAVDLLRG